MFFGMGPGGHGGNCLCGENNNTLLLLILLGGCGCNICKDDIVELLFLVMLLECFGCGNGCNR